MGTAALDPAPNFSPFHGRILPGPPDSDTGRSICKGEAVTVALCRRERRLRKNARRARSSKKTTPPTTPPATPPTLTDEELELGETEAEGADGEGLVIEHENQ